MNKIPRPKNRFLISHEGNFFTSDFKKTNRPYDAKRFMIEKVAERFKLLINESTSIEVDEMKIIPYTFYL